MACGRLHPVLLALLASSACAADGDAPEEAGGALHQRPIFELRHNGSPVERLEVPAMAPLDLQVVTLDTGGVDELGCPAFHSIRLDARGEELRLRAFHTYEDRPCGGLVQEKTLDYQLSGLPPGDYFLVFETMGCATPGCDARPDGQPAPDGRIPVQVR